MRIHYDFRTISLQSAYSSDLERRRKPEQEAYYAHMNGKYKRRSLRCLKIVGKIIGRKKYDDWSKCNPGINTCAIVGRVQLEIKLSFSLSILSCGKKFFVCNEIMCAMQNRITV